MKTRSPSDLLTGLMWMVPELVRQNDIGLRHWCEQGDNLGKKTKKYLIAPRLNSKISFYKKSLECLFVTNHLQINMVG